MAPGNREGDAVGDLGGFVDAPTACITLPSILGLLVLLLVGPTAHAVMPTDAHVGMACVHGETHNWETPVSAKLFQAAVD